MDKDPICIAAIKGGIRKKDGSAFELNASDEILLLLSPLLRPHDEVKRRVLTKGVFCSNISLADISTDDIWIIKGRYRLRDFFEKRRRCLCEAWVKKGFFRS